MDQDHKKNEVPTSSGEGKLWIKLKINPIEFEQRGAQPDDQDNRIRPQKNDEPRVCNVCNKGFNSGKALGGHMRVHVQASKELKSNSSSTNNGRSSGCGVGSDKTICSLCGKNFPSMKSLFGHMRCHPEREWRGIQPPPQAKSSPISSSVSDPEYEEFQNMVEESGIDLTESLPSWCVKAKRGRKALETEEEQLFDAVEDLMRLARGDSLESGLTHKNRVDGCDFDGTNSNYLIEIETKKRRIEEIRNCCYPVKLRMEERGPTEVKKLDKLGKGKALVLKTEKSVDELDGEKSDRSNTTIPSEEQLIMTYKYCKSTNSSDKKKRKKLKLRDVESVRESNMIRVDDETVEMMARDKYKCSTCSKCFPTHQALGGHRSSHNKVKIISHNMDESTIAAGEEGNELEAKPASRAEVNKEEEGAGSSTKLVVAAESSHQCKICSKVFATGQALGGHKRCHWTGSADQAGGSSLAGSPGEASQTGRKVLEIDLNELPVMEDEEDGYEYYASNSSHASVG